MVAQKHRVASGANGAVLTVNQARAKEMTVKQSYFGADGKSIDAKDALDENGKMKSGVLVVNTISKGTLPEGLTPTGNKFLQKKGLMPEVGAKTEKAPTAKAKSSVPKQAPAPPQAANPNSRQSQKKAERASQAAKLAKQDKNKNLTPAEVKKLAGIERSREGIKKKYIARQTKDLIKNGYPAAEASKEAERIVTSQIKKGYYRSEFSEIGKKATALRRKANERALSKDLASL